ncbi:MAG: ribose-phosphate diphosphokinase [Candidatus Altiarchaeota archaeon]|nr:ribose-phosphate diphosphokinase [Candidatus Altiarchaeota archaeon]
MIVLSSKKSAGIAEEVVKSLKATFGRIDTKTFPDGEVYVRIRDKVEGKDIVYIHTAQNNNDLIELFLALSAFKENKAKRITCVIPYLAYSRQDEAFLDGEAISAQTILRSIASYADEIVTVNAHFLNEAGKFEFGGVTLHNLDAFPLLAKYFKHVKKPVVLSPDEGSLYYAKEAASVIKCEFDYLVKRRISGEDVEMQPKHLDVHGKDVIILDDIISTGGTIIRASERLKEHGALGVYVGCVHGVFAKGTGMFKELNELICTDTIPMKLSMVSVAPLIAEYLKKSKP